MEELAGLRSASKHGKDLKDNLEKIADPSAKQEHINNRMKNLNEREQLATQRHLTDNEQTMKMAGKALGGNDIEVERQHDLRATAAATESSKIYNLNENTGGGFSSRTSFASAHFNKETPSLNQNFESASAGNTQIVEQIDNSANQTPDREHPVTANLPHSTWT